MNAKIIEVNFKGKQEKLDEKVILASDDKMQFENLKNDERLEKLQTRLGKSKEEIKKIINALHSL